MPEALFKTSGKGGTHAKVCVLCLEKNPSASTPLALDYDVFMADAKWCGHDSRGNPTLRKNAEGQMVVLDDVPTIALRYAEFIKGQFANQDHLGFSFNLSQLRNGVLVPKYYDPEIVNHLAARNSTHDLVTVGELIQQEALSITTGVEVGKMAYGTGLIPFIRTSDISNWELKSDPKQGVSESIYRAYKSACDVQAGDILMVRDGTYLIGTSAIVTESDTKMLFQSHIYKIRVLRPDIINPWLLFACLNTAIVKKQIRSKQFTQDIIDTLGNRIAEIVLPIPKDKVSQKSIAKTTRKIVQTRTTLRNQAKQLVLDIEGLTDVGDDDQELLMAI
jgi:type I restriction enzyme M protein